MSGVVMKCPLCDWTHSKVYPHVTEDTLAGVFGAGVMQAVAKFQVNEETERVLKNHLSSHVLMDWVSHEAKSRELMKECMTICSDANASELYDKLKTHLRV